ncbi:MAG: hypothetical protein EOM52_00625 [Clostridia bacterium]|nr:hypothetical protein [Clostridia bacterium]
MEYKAGTSLIYGKYSAEFEQDKERSEGDGTPVYSQATRRLTLSGNMYWLDPSTGREWLVSALSSLRMDESGAVWCSDGRKDVRIEGGFLSDAAGTFLFLDGMTLRWNGRTDRVEPFSFYSFSADGKVRVYRYEEGELIYEDDLGQKDTGVSDRGYEIDFTSGVYIGADGSRRLLVSDPKLLTSIFR